MQLALDAPELVHSLILLEPGLPDVPSGALLADAFGPMLAQYGAGDKEGRRLIVVRGDNLWNIARAHYGVGFHHTVIYGANKEQIRNPDLIYPGQVFSLPKVN